ncbi:MAG: helicase-related protein, partial [Pseudobdellovibrionaceae bacterium]
RERQFLVFSATLNFDVLNTAYQFGAEPIECYVSREQAKAENVKDEIFHVGNNDKPMYLLSLIKKVGPKQVIIFSNFKTSVDRLARFLTLNGIPAAGISSLLTQVQRNRVMERFKTENDTNILVATDVAARGLDIKGVDLVINYEMPGDPENYVHRIGRTGRAGATGTAFSLVSDRDVDALSRVEDYLKHKLPIGWMEDADLIREFQPIPRDDGSLLKSYDEEGEGSRDRGDRGQGFRGPRRGPGSRNQGRGPRDDRGGKDRHHKGRDFGKAAQGRDFRKNESTKEGRENRHESGRHESGRHEGGRPEDRHDNRKHGNRPQHGKHSQHKKQDFSKRPHKQGHSKKHLHGKPKQAPGLLGKVSGFFKKLLGGKNSPPPHKKMH